LPHCCHVCDLYHSAFQPFRSKEKGPWQIRNYVWVSVVIISGFGIVSWALFRFNLETDECKIMTVRWYADLYLRKLQS
jgi:hypothetical protein